MKGGSTGRPKYVEGGGEITSRYDRGEGRGEGKWQPRLDVGALGDRPGSPGPFGVGTSWDAGWSRRRLRRRPGCEKRSPTTLALLFYGDAI